MTSTLFDSPAYSQAPKWRPVLAATSWQTNADMIYDLAAIGYLKPEHRTLDCTFGLGKWWTRWQPAQLVGTDRDYAKGQNAVADFTALPFADNSFDVVVFDPPYIPNQGEKSTITEFTDRFGLEVPAHVERMRPEELEALINRGLHEAARVSSDLILMKCMTYQWGDKLRLGPVRALNYAESIGLECIEWLDHIGHARAQPWDYQKTARRNYSNLLVFQK